MAFENWNPLAELEEMRSRMDQLLQKSRQAAENSPPGHEPWQPGADIYEDKLRLIVEVDLPGVAQEHIQVRIDNGLLLIEGRREHPGEHRSLELQHGERVWGEFSRQFVLPDDLDSARTQANCENGVLRVVIPKTVKAPGRIEIEVK